MLVNNKCFLCGNKLPPLYFELCPDCTAGLTELCRDIFITQPNQKRDIDQFGMDHASVISQNVFLNNSYRGNYAAFFGGYDGVGLLANEFGEKGVIILDVDREVLHWWEQIGRKNGFDVISFEYDALNPISEEVIKEINDYKIDLWRTDPPFNCPGMCCFLTRIFYLNESKSPLYLCIPEGTDWSQLLKHNVWQYVLNNGMNISSVSPSLYHYPHPEGPNSFAQKLEVADIKPIMENTQFEYNIYGPTPEFSTSPFGCHQYDNCLRWRNKWDASLS